MLNYTAALDFLDRKLITHLYFDGFAWNASDEKNNLSSKRKLTECIACAAPVFGVDLPEAPAFFLNADYSHLMHHETEIEQKLLQDTGVFNYFECKFFNSIWVDPITKQWILGDQVTGIPASIGDHIRDLVDLNHIGKEGSYKGLFHVK